MSVESEIKALRQEVFTLHQKLDFLVTEKSLNQDFEYIKALQEARKGNHKALQSYAKKKYEVNKKLAA